MPWNWPRPVPPGRPGAGRLRQVYGRLDEDLFWLAARAIQIVDWDRTRPVLQPLRAPKREPRGPHECPDCGQIHFPRIAPAVIVLVERENQILMARSRHFAPECSASWRALSSRGNPGGNGGPGGKRGKRHPGKGHPLFRQPALAFPGLAHDRVHGQICGGRDRPRRFRWKRRAGTPSTTCHRIPAKSASPGN